MERSLSQKLNSRRRFRYSTLMSLILLAFMFGSLMIVNNPRSTDAATLLPQTLPIPVTNPMTIYDGAITYLIGGYFHSWYILLQKVDMSNMSTTSLTLTPGGTHDSCWQRQNSAAVFNPTTKKAYLIGGKMGWGNVQVGNPTASITEIDFNGGRDIQGLFPAKCSLYGNGVAPTVASGDQLNITGPGYADFIAHPRDGASAFYYDNKIYIMGGEYSTISGRRSTYHHLKEVFVLDTTTLTMTKITPVGLDSFGYRAHASVVFDPVTTRAYVFGGDICSTITSGDIGDCAVNASPNTSNGIFIFDPTSGAETFTAVANPGTIFATSSVPQGIALDSANSKITLLVKRTPLGVTYYEVVEFDIQAQTLTITSKTPPSLIGYGSVFYNDKIYTFGGSATSSIYQITLSNISPTSATASGVKISKRLLAEKRNGTTGNSEVNTNYNAYALQKGDVIRINLVISLLPSSDDGYVTVTDTALAIQQGSLTGLKCNPDNYGTFSPPSSGGVITSSTVGGITTKKVVWTNLSVTSAGPATVNYYCTVE